MTDPRLILVAGFIAFVLAVLLAHHLFHHVRSHRTIGREAERWGWDERRKVHEIKAMKRRRGIRAKLRRRR